MWPWEHLAIGYLLYSGVRHTTGGDPPTRGAVLAVLVGSQFPDLVDKPLGWTVQVLASGVSVAHSVLTALALSGCVILLARRLGHPQLGIAFAVGYLAHIPADMLYPLLLGGPLYLESYLWPLVTVSGPARGGLVANVGYYLVRFLLFLATPRGVVFLLLEGVLLGTAAAVWFRDGHPGIPVHRELTRR